ncbi:MAG: hypothetical protein LBK59_05855 [Bifidobacteriaceae bacterium]|nr:hypothetical protein [Bifidobacteriaceae bacterium]
MHSKHIFVAFTNAADGRDLEFNEFYDRYHIPEVLTAPGWLSAQRYRLCVEQKERQTPTWQYLVIYEVERPEGEILSALDQRADFGPAAHPDPWPWKDDSQVWIYESLGPRHERGT